MAIPFFLLPSYAAILPRTSACAGRDFYAAPRLNPSGDLLAYICWDHPSMPWDATELRVCRVGHHPPLTSSHVLLDGEDSDTSILQPAWHPTSGALYYLSDSSGYHNLRRIGGAHVLGGGSSPVAILPREVDFGGAAPGWSLGQQGYAFLADGRVAAHIANRSTGETNLLVFSDVEGGDGEGEGDVAAAVQASLTTFTPEDGLPHSFGSITPAPDGTLYLLGGGPQVPSGIYAWRGLNGGSNAQLLACSSNVRIPEGYISCPQPVEFPSPMGTSHGYYYPPANADARSDESAPPLLVKAHGGPTACTGSSFNPTIQFFTSRGFAVLDVDYGGSTGYGRSYRRRLRGKWGIVDIDGTSPADRKCCIWYALCW